MSQSPPFFSSKNMSSPWNLPPRSPAPTNLNLNHSGSPYGMSPVQISSSIPSATYLTSDAETQVNEEEKPFSIRQNSNVDCAVCQENFLDGESIRRLPCNHQYHALCVDPWLQLHARCPLCNHQMPGTLRRPAASSNNTQHSSTNRVTTSYRRPARERVGRRKKRAAQRNADLVTGAWLDHIVGGLSLEGISDDDMARPAFFPLNEDMVEEFVENVTMPKSYQQNGMQPPPKIDSRDETRGATFDRHWIKIQKKVRKEISRLDKDHHHQQHLWRFICVFEEYVLALSKERRHGKITALPPCTDGDLLSTMSAPPLLESYEEDGRAENNNNNNNNNNNSPIDIDINIPRNDGNDAGESKVGDSNQTPSSKNKSKKKKELAVLFYFQSGAHRLMAHGVCQFHGLHCKSVTTGGKRVFRVHRIKKFSKRDNIHSVTLASDLKHYLANSNSRLLASSQAVALQPEQQAWSDEQNMMWTMDL